MSPADLADYADETQKQQKQQQPSPTCLSLRDNAACCIPLRDLRYLRENIPIRVLNQYCSNETPVSPADLADLRRQTPKQQNNNTQTNCLSLRDNAACCIPLRDLRYLRENIHMRVLNQTTQKKPQYLPQISQIYADEPQNHKTTLTSPNCLSLRNNAACCIRLRDLRDLRENNTQEYSINLQTRNPNKAPADLADYADKNPTTTITTKQH